VVPKERAALAYGDTVRRKIDPALLEWSGAGVFSARVFPLEPKKMHRIVLGYEVNLLPIGDELEYRLDLPEEVPDLRVTVTVDGEVRIEKRNPDERSFLVRVPAHRALMITGQDLTGDYFGAYFRPEVPPTAKSSTRRGVFLVDVSLSSNPERFNVWLLLLRTILERNREEMREFAVVFFNIETFAWKQGFVANTPANVEALLGYANQLALEGATDLGRALAAAREFDGDIFLLSDGAPTWGEDDLHALKPERPVFAYATGFSGTDTRVLLHLARKSGGGVFSVVGESEVEAAAVAHRSQPWLLERVSVAGGSDLLLAGRPIHVYPGQRFWLAGRGKPGSDTDDVVMTLRQGAKITSVRTRIGRRVVSGFAPSVYGQIAVGQLEELGYAAEQTTRAYATHFRVVGKTCSLLMLDSEADYQRFNIKPAEDAYVVKKQPAAITVSETLALVERVLSDPKQRLLAWLARLEKMPGMEYETPRALRLALEEMPSDAFLVDAGALECRTRVWKDVPGSVQEQLASRKLSYDAITAEAARRRAEFGAPDGLRALSSLVEHRPGDLVLARDIGYTAQQWGLGAQAFHLFRRVAEQRPFEPNTWLAMAHCLEAMGKHDLALVYFEVALAGSWSNRFGDFTEVAAYDYVRFLRTARLRYLDELAKDRSRTVARSLKVREADLVVTIAWTTDRTDVDLHVKDPRGEDCFYGNRKTKLGGRITRDVTSGFGPELFVIEDGVKGAYDVRVKYFASDATRMSTRTRVLVTIYEDWGRPTERMTRRMVTLASGQQMHPLATIHR